MHTEIEDLDKRDNQLLYKKVQEVVGKRKFNKKKAIKKRDGTIAKEVEDAKTRCNEYIGEQFRDQGPETYGSEQRWAPLHWKGAALPLPLRAIRSAAPPAAPFQFSP